MQILFGLPGDSSLTPWFSHLSDDPATASETVWLTATQRKREWVISRFHQAKRQFPPRIHTFDELSHTLYQRLGGTDQLIDTKASQLIMHIIVSKLELGDLIDTWFSRVPGTGFLNEITRQIDEFQRHGSSVEHLDAVPDAADGIGTLFQALYQHYHSYLELNHLIDNGKMQLELCHMLQNSAPHLSDSSHDTHLPYKRLILDGFLELTPLQMDIIHSLDSILEVTLVWPGHPQSEGVYQWLTAGLKARFPGANWKALHDDQSLSLTAQAARQLSQVKPDSLPMDVKPVPDSHGTLRIINAATILDEVEQIAKDIKQRLQPEPVPDTSHRCNQLRPEEIAITFPDLRNYANLVRRIFKRYNIPVNIRQSLPLTGSPIFVALERILRLPGRWHNRDVLAVIRDPLLSGWNRRQTQTASHKLLNWTNKYRIVRGYNQWLSGLQKIIADIPTDQPDYNIATQLMRCLTDLNTILGDSTRKRSLTAWLVWTRQLLSKLEWNVRLDKLQRSITQASQRGSDHFEFTRRAYNQLLMFFDSLEHQISCSDTDDSAQMDLQEFQSMLPRLVSGIEYQLTTQEGDRVQVLGLLGIRGSSYKHVYFGGLTEVAFPTKSVISPFWSPELVDVLLERPAHFDRVQGFADLIRIMSVATDTFTISYPTQAGDEIILPSQLWEFILSVFSDRGQQVTTTDLPLCEKDLLQASATAVVAGDTLTTAIDNMAETNENLHFKSALRSIYDEKSINASRKTCEGPWNSHVSTATLMIRELLMSRVGPLCSFSPTKLECYIACPRKFFFDYVLKLSELEIPEDHLTSLEKGSLIHTVLEKFYTERLQKCQGRIRINEVLTSSDRIKEIAQNQFHSLGTGFEVARQQLADILGRPEIDDPGIAYLFSKREAEIAPDIQPLHLEWRFGQKQTDRELLLQDAEGQPLYLEGKIDRIDRCGDELIIWDYKTGKLPQAKEINNLTRIQVGLYLLAIQRLFKLPVSIAGYYRISGREPLELKPVLRRSNSHATTLFGKPPRKGSLEREWSESELQVYLQNLETMIASAVAKMRRGQFPATPEPTLCRLCNHKALCRVEKELQ